jgi:hypothetical protein
LQLPIKPCGFMPTTFVLLRGSSFFMFYSNKNMEDIIKKIDSRQRTAGFEPLCVMVYRDNSFGVFDI